MDACAALDATFDTMLAVYAGSAKETVDCFGANGCNDYKFKDLRSHDIMLGLRWTCCDNEQPAPRYVYQPQPYTPPPVRLGLNKGLTFC